MSWVIAIITLLIGGIIYFSLQGPSDNSEVRDQFLDRLEKEYKGTKKPIAGKKDSYSVEFTFEGEHFVFEDVIAPGFDGSFDKNFLRAKTTSGLTISFSEKERKKVITSEIFLASEGPKTPVEKRENIELPKKLQNLDIHTNNPPLAKKLFEDPKVAKIFESFKNVDSRGSPSVALKVFEGVLTLEFYSSGAFLPNVHALRGDFPSMENYLDKMLVVIRVLNRIVI